MEQFGLQLPDIFGISAFVLQLVAYALYAHDVFRSKIRPNVATWGMWFLGGIIELITYQAIEGSHWSASALPLACTIGVGTICLAILISQIRSTFQSSGLIFLKPEKIDYAMAGFDLSAGALWLMGILTASWANILAVSTSIASFYPIYRTTYDNPSHEKPTSWGIWALSYLAMICAVMTSEDSGEWSLYFYPIYYFILHIAVFGIAFRSSIISNIKEQ